MEVSGLYNFVLVLVLAGMICGIGVLVVDKTADSTGVTTTAAVAFDAGRDAISGIGTSWFSLIVTIGILSIILGLVIAGFSNYNNQ